MHAIKLTLTVCVALVIASTTAFAQGLLVNKTISPATIAVNGTTTMEIVITNKTGATLNGISFTDMLPAGVVVSNPSGLNSSGCVDGLGLTRITAAPGSGSVSLSGYTAFNNAICIIDVSLTGIAPGNGSNCVTVSPGAVQSCAPINVLVPPPTIAKAFGAPNIAFGGSTSLTFTLTNPNSTALTGVGFNDTLPAGLVLGPAATPSCTAGSSIGTVSAVAGSKTFSVSGASLAANGSCTISDTVIGTAPGSQSNTTDRITSIESGSGATSNTAIVGVGPQPPTITKAFGAASVVIQNPTTLTFMIANPNVTALTGVAFTDALPAGLVLGPTVTSNCTAGSSVGTIVATPGSQTFSLTGGALAAGGSCTISDTVIGTIVGNQPNTTGAISSTETGPGSPSNTANLNVLPTPPFIVVKFFTPIPPGGNTIKQFIIANGVTFGPTHPGAPIPNINFVDTLPVGLLVGAAGVVSNNCGGTATAVPGSNTITIAGVTVLDMSACTLLVSITAATSGSYQNCVTVNPLGNKSCDILLVTPAAPPVIMKSFAVPTVLLNGSTSVTFTVTNPNTNTIPLNNISFTDMLPAGLVVATPNGLNPPTGCNGEVPTAVAGSGSIALPAQPLLSLAPGASCTFSVNVTGIAAGPQNNCVQASIPGPGGGNTSCVMLAVLAPPTIKKMFGAPTILLNASTSLTFTITNPNPTVALTGVNFNDMLPSGLVVATPNALSATTCVPPGTLLAMAGSGVVSLATATIAGGGSCTFSINVTGISPGLQNNSVTVSDTTAGVGNTSMDSLIVIAPPGITKAFGATSIVVGASTSLTFTIANSNTTVALNGVAFTDTLPAGLIVATPNGLNPLSGCNGTVPTAVAGTNLISLTGATIGVSSSCTFAVNVTGVTSGTKDNVTSIVSSTNGGNGPPAAASILVGAPLGVYQLRYFANLQQADSYVNATNVGAVDGFDPNGRICANFYVFDPREELVSCCACLITPNGLVSLSARNDLVSNTLTGAPLSAGITVKVLANLPTPMGGTVCNPSSPTVAGLAPGLKLWAVTPHPIGAAFQLAETEFASAELSANELAKLTGLCRFLQTASGFGVCRSCPAVGAQGAEIQSGSAIQ